MSLIRLLARPMLASAYVANGVARVRNPQTTAHTLEPVLSALGDRLPGGVTATAVARGTGVAQAAAGVLLGLGKMPRLAASVLVGSYVLDTVADIVGKEDGESKTSGLLGRTSLLGGALLASVDTAGKPGLAWRANHAAESLRKEVEKTTAKLAPAKH